MHANHLSPVAQERRGYTPAPAISPLQLDHIRDLIDWVCESSSSAALRPGGVKQALQNRIRAQYGLNHIAELPARHFHAVVAMLEQAKRDCDDFRWHIRKQGDRYIRNVIGGGHPSTSHRRRLSQQEAREVRS